jgi:hypothetical protein
MQRAAYVSKLDGYRDGWGYPEAEVVLIDIGAASP